MSGGPSTSNDGRIQRAPQNGGNGMQRAPEKRSIAQQLDTPEFKRALAQALPKHMGPDKMARIAMTALRTTRELAQCSPESFFATLMQAAQLGLEVNTPSQHAYLIPRRLKGQLEATLILGFQGMIELAMRSGKVEKVWTRVVHEGDFFRVKYGLEEDIEHVPSDLPNREQQPITFVYAVAALKSGGKVFEVLSRAQIDARRPANSNIWAQHYEQMARKTAVRSLFKWIPKSSEMALAESLDERADTGRAQVFDSTINDTIGSLGMQPIDAEGETAPHDPQTGEVLAQPEPGANG